MCWLGMIGWAILIAILVLLKYEIGYQFRRRFWHRQH